MYITTGDIIAVIIALSVSMALIATTAVRNAQLTRQVGNYRRMYIIQRDINRGYDNHKFEGDN